MIAVSFSRTDPRQVATWTEDAEQSFRRSIRNTVVRWIVGALLALFAAAALQLAFFTPQAQAIEETPDEGTWHVSGGRVEASILSEDGKTLYIGGNFNKVWEQAPGTGGDSFAVNGLAAIDVESGAALRSWRPGVSGEDGHVYALEVKGNSIFVGGSFSAVNGQPRQHLAEVDATDGSLKPFAPNVVGNNPSIVVRALEASNNKLYVGGGFYRVDGESRGNLAAFDLPGRTLDQQWEPRARGIVRALELATDDETIFATGSFDFAQGSTDADFTERKVVARFNSNSGELHPWSVPKNILRGDEPQTGWVLLATPNRLYGGFGDRGANYVKSLRLNDGNTGSQDWSFNTVGDPYALALSEDGSRLFTGGHFGTVRLTQTNCGEKVYALISLNPQTGQPYCDWIPKMELYNKDQWNGHTVHTIRSIGNYVWVGGRFYSVTEVEQRSLARFSIVTPPEPIPAPNPIGEVKVNFQDGDAPVPAGYVKDFGEKFGSRNGEDQGQGLYYGWVEPGTDNRIPLVGDGRDRNNDPDQRLDTLMHMQKSAEGAWEMSVPNGRYRVTASVGDASYFDSVHDINVEGQSLINNVSLTNSNKFADATGTFTVTDERLTVDPIGGENTKINYINIESLDRNVLAFDGSNDWVSIPDSQQLNLTDSTQRTFEFWMKTGSNVNDRQFLYEQGGQHNGFSMETSGGRLYFNAWSKGNGWGTVHADAAINPNTVYRVAGVYDEPSGVLRLYLDGALQDASPGAGIMKSHGDDLAIGGIAQTTRDHTDAVVSSGSNLEGRVGEFRAWGDVRTEGQIRNNMDVDLSGTEANLIALYEFGEGAGNVLNDSGPYDLDAAIFGATWDTEQR